MSRAAVRVGPGAGTASRAGTTDRSILSTGPVVVDRPSGGGATTFDPGDPVLAIPTVAGVIRPAPPRLPGEHATELACQQTIVDAARLLGYRVLAIRAAAGGKRGGGWASPIQGDRGAPDLLLVHPVAGVIHAECKRWPNRLEPSQARWGRALLDAGAHWHLVWVPEELDAFVQALADWTRP